MDTTTIVLFTFTFFAPMAIMTIAYGLTDRSGGYLGGPPALAQRVTGSDARIEAEAPATAAANDEEARAAA